MTREEQAKRREKIKQLYAAGVPTKELADQFGLSKAYIYQFIVCSRKQNAINRLRETPEDVKIMINEGMTTSEIGDKYGVSRSMVSLFLKEIGINRKSFNHNDEETVAQKIKKKTGGLLEYVSGYTNKMGHVRVRCAVCGGEFERSFHNITAKYVVSCPYCTKRLSDIDKELRSLEKIDKAWAKAAKAYERQFDIDDKPTNIIPHICPVCGAITTKPKYCSEHCRNKAMNTAGEHRRRVAIKSAMVDSDITVMGLFKRDRGVCAICGKPCDLNDYERRNGYFIAGNNYPSVDHIIPLAKGGEHSWDNVQLAHRICNVIKSDNV